MDTLIKLRMLKFFFPLAIGQWWREVWRKDLNELECCNPTFLNPCGCYGATIRDNYQFALRKKKEATHG